ncbi:hypothetical protein [Bdellovibrio sp. HCB209]|uniref:hypothetical protein n=1 Tax=Bdellovibrio sp. HCB209 TaxID=3394354 RepID=UPI0039B637A8
MNVSCKSLLLLVASATLLSGCEEPSVSVSSLGRKLAAPVLTSSSPFDQDMDTVGYVRVTGTCDKRVGPVIISFDDSTYHSANTSVTIGGTVVTNDNDCSDGKFDIYLTSADLLATWGIDTNDDNSKVSNIFIKGETFFGDTHPLKIVDSKINDPSQTGEPAKLALRKVFPESYGGADTCEMFNVVVTDKNGNETSAKAPVTFQIANSTGNAIGFYLSQNDCSSTYNGQSSITIAASTSYKQIYMKMPPAPIDGAIEFSLANISSSASLTAATASTPVVLRDPAGSRRFIATTDMPGSLYKDVCYPIVLQRMNYNKISPYEVTPLTLTLTPSDSKMEFFTENNCAAGFKTSTVNFSSSISRATIYAKYNSGGATSSTSANVKVTYTASDANYDTPPFAMKVDTSTKSTVKKLDFWGPNSISRSACNAYTIVTANENWTSIPADKDYIVSLGSTQSLAGLEFYTDEGCYTSTGNTITISQDKVATKVYVKATGSQNTTGQISISATGLNTVIRDYTLSVASGQPILSMAIPDTIYRGQCVYIKMEFPDTYGNTINAMSPLNMMFYSLSGSGNLISGYLDENCTTPIAEGALMSVMPYNATMYRFFIKVDSSYAPSSLSLSFQATSLFAIPSITRGFNVTNSP